MADAVLDRGSNPARGPSLLPKEARGKRQVGERNGVYSSVELACDCTGKQGQSWGGLGDGVKNAGRKHRFEA